MHLALCTLTSPADIDVIRSLVERGCRFAEILQQDLPTGPARMGCVLTDAGEYLPLRKDQHVLMIVTDDAAARLALQGISPRAVDQGRWAVWLVLPENEPSTIN